LADITGVYASPGNPGRGSRGAGGRRASDPSDERLVELVSEGHQSALGQLYDRYRRPAYSLARRICAEDGLTEEVLQEVFLTLWRDPQRFDPSRGRFSSWLLTLVHHKAVDSARRESANHRRLGSAEPDDETAGPAVPGADQPAIGALEAVQVRDALRRLPDDQRRALALSYYGGYTQQEVASITGVPLGTVKARTFNAMQRLRRLLSPLLVDSGEGR
jgi:RNA polymerase sigma-70 factor (ECF subfamily)